MHLSKHTEKLGSVEFRWSKGSDRAPYIQLVPGQSVSSKGTKKKGAKFQVHLHFGMQSIDWIPQLRLVPNRCNIKDSDEKDTQRKLIQSQLYNQSLLFDARHQFEDEHLTSEDLVDHPNVEATLVLIQIWALKRGLWRNHDGWTKENVAIFLLYMLRTNRMNPRMTPIQQFTVVLQMWSTTNWLGSSGPKGKSGNDREIRASQSEASQYSKSKRQRRDVLVLPEEDSTEKETIRNSEFARLYEKQTKESPLTIRDPSTLVELYASGEHYGLGPVLLDPTMTYNFLGDVSPNYMKLLQSHATRSLEGLKESQSTFSNIFMKNARFWSQWDMYVKIPLKKKGTEEWETSIRCLVGKLELALGNRIRGIRVLSTGNGNVSLEKEDLDQIPSSIIDKKASFKERSLFLSPTYSGEIVLGIAIDPETSQRVVDRGPPSDQQKEVRSFVQLWGDKAQLRRFKDGAIVQAVIWNDDDGNDRYQNQIKLQGGYVDKIVRHIVRLHYSKTNIEFALPHLTSVVDGISNTKEKMSTQSGDPVATHQDVMKAFDALSQFLRAGSQPSHYRNQNQNFVELPLMIDAVEPLSACLRYSELFPPTPHPFLGGRSSNNKQVSGAILSQPIEVQIRFESSSKWPSDLKAIGAAKTAMLIQLANSIEALNSRDFDGPIQVSSNYLDLGYRGYCFRIFIRPDPEIKLLKGLVRPSPVASSILKALTRVHVVAAKHHSMMHSVYTLHPSSSGVVRMAKRWVANHMLSGLITTEAIELMVAKVYSNNGTPLETPSTVASGFLRFLQLLAFHDWLG